MNETSQDTLSVPFSHCFMCEFCLSRVEFLLCVLLLHSIPAYCCVNIPSFPFSILVLVTFG